MKCIECDNERDAPRGNSKLRTRCRICWNRYMSEYQKTHREYFSNYIKEYNKNRIKIDKIFRKKIYTINNKSNKKAIAELKDSYVKYRVTDGKKWDENSTPLIEIKRNILIIQRLCKEKQKK